MPFVNTSSQVHPRFDPPPESDLLTIVQLARAGDILSIIPAVDAMREGRRVNWLAHENFAPILDHLSWVNKFTYHGGDSQVAQAIDYAKRFIGGQVIATQVNGNPTPKTQENFILDQWFRAGMMERFHDCPLVFDKPPDKSFPKTGKPILAYCMSGYSSPFPRGREFTEFLQGFASDYELMDLSSIRMPSVVDLLPMLRAASVLVTVDSALLHLAHATGTPTIALSRPNPWFMSEPRYHWIERYTYDQALDKRTMLEIGAVLRDPRTPPQMRGRLCRNQAGRQAKIVHVVDWFNATGEMKRRHEFARETWRDVASADKNWQTIERVNAGRSSRELGDTRDLPYLKDVIDTAVDRAGDGDIVVLTNADTCLFPETPATIRREMAPVPCLCAGRIDVAKDNSRPFYMRELLGNGIYVGTDVFAFVPGWWRKVRDSIPDLLIACEGWDFVMWKTMEQDNPRARLAYPLCYHETHSAPWSAEQRHSIGQQHNRQLGREWAHKSGLAGFLDDGRFLFRASSRHVRPPKQASNRREIGITMEDRTSVPPGSALAVMIGTIIDRATPRRILETGTYHGVGTTRIVLDALKSSMLSAEFYSIECNPENYKIAEANLRGEPVNILRGLSVPRELLPSHDQIQRSTVEKIPESAAFADHDPEDRASMYMKETDYPGDDNGIGHVLKHWGGHADLVILDSAGHLGRIEFDYLIRSLISPAFIVLDDTKHVKHASTLDFARKDRRFEILFETDERHGSAILEFTPERPAGRLLPRIRS